MAFKIGDKVITPIFSRIGEVFEIVQRQHGTKIFPENYRTEYGVYVLFPHIDNTPKVKRFTRVIVYWPLEDLRLVEIS